jgi:dihydrodipicolinate synthase/N-acetylneuraminate lyase
MISGINAALITPLSEDGQLDRSGLERVLSRIVAAGVSGVSPAGSTGEGPRLPCQMRLDLAAAVKRLVPAEMAVVPNVPCNSVQDALREINQLADLGCSGILVAPPPYFRLADDDVQRFYELVADRSPLPVVIYNIPTFTKIKITPAVVGALAGHPGISGIKDSSKDLGYLAQIVTASHSDLSVLTGDDSSLLDSLTLGGDGAIAASVNLVPELAAGVFRLYRDGQAEEAQVLQTRLTRVVRTCRRGRYPSGWKSALEIAGLCERWLASPASPLPAADHDVLADHLAQLEIGVLAR